MKFPKSHTFATNWKRTVGLEQRAFVQFSPVIEEGEVYFS
jgi:hypothetical protein